MAEMQAFLVATADHKRKEQPPLYHIVAGHRALGFKASVLRREVQSEDAAASLSGLSYGVAA